ncbi:MAG: TetR/AcrR family transcriptional regulator [Anaerolineae bacterium]
MLQEALISLVQEQEFSSLRIQDITDRADLGRATFYMHYTDKEDLLAAVAEKACIEIESELEKVAGRREFIGLRWGLEHAKDRPQLYRVVLGHQKSVERIRRFIITRVSESLTLLHAEQGIKPDFSIPVTSHIIAGGMLAILNWWLENPDKLSPKALQEHFNLIITQGVPHLLTLRDDHA